ncbi:MAG: ABC transporter permease [Gemmataceae bacterium]|nr:ABC transporter permease [Gemmataceae bacterium]
MDTPSPMPALKINRWLPYWAVFGADARQTVQSWIYRLWVLLSLAAAAGFLLYRFGAKQQAGFVQPAPEMISDLLTWVVWGSVTLIIVLTAGTISGERGIVADSVLSRGISRYQYFLGKWHARLAVILGTYLVLVVLALAGAFVLLHSDMLTLDGCAVAIAVVGALLVLVVTCGVSVSALSTNTVVSITLVWLLLYGAGFLMSLLPANYPAPDRALHNLPHVLRGVYDLQMVGRLISGALSLSLLIAIVGMIGFARRDV